MNYIDEDNMMIITNSPIVGTLVKTPQNKIIGEITGVILNTVSGDAPYVLLSLHENQNKAEKKHTAISWNDFEENTSHSHEYILDPRKIKLADLPQFNSGYQPAYSQYELMDAVPFVHGWERKYHTFSSK